MHIHPQKELNGMMAIYAQFNFQDLPSDTLEPMPMLEKYFPRLAALLPLKQSGKCRCEHIRGKRGIVVLLKNDENHFLNK